SAGRRPPRHWGLDRRAPQDLFAHACLPRIRSPPLYCPRPAASSIALRRNRAPHQANRARRCGRRQGFPDVPLERAVLTLLQLPITRARQPHQLVTAKPTSDRVGERPVDPVEGAKAVALSELEGSVVEPRLLAQVEREPPAGAVLVHELGCGKPPIR